MKSITIHGLEHELASLITARAKASGQSLNKTIKDLLAQALGMTPARQDRHRADFADLCGVWSAKDRQAFEAATADLRTIDPADWK